MKKKYYNANELKGELTRKKILDLLAENYVLSASLISHTLLLSYATVLKHLKILNESGYIELYKEGKELKAKIKQNFNQLREIQNGYSFSEPFLNSSSTLNSNKNEIRKNQIPHTKNK